MKTTQDQSKAPHLKIVQYNNKGELAALTLPDKFDLINLADAVGFVAPKEILSQAASDLEKQEIANQLKSQRVSNILAVGTALWCTIFSVGAAINISAANVADSAAGIIGAVVMGISTVAMTRLGKDTKDKCSAYIQNINSRLSQKNED